MMRAIQLTRLGGPEALKLIDCPTREPAFDDALIKIAAAGANYKDVSMRRG